MSLDCLDGTYKYAVPNQWQGRHDKLLVVGDKKGAGSSQALLRDPELLNELRRTIKFPVRIIHVVRNPFDTISRIHMRSGNELQRSVDRFFKLCRGTAAVLQDNPNTVLTLRHEDYVANPKRQLAEVCQFVGVDSTAEYLADCAKVVRRSTRLARLEVNWTPPLIHRVTRLMDRYEFLRGYHFHEESVHRGAAT